MMLESVGFELGVIGDWHGRRRVLGVLLHDDVTATPANF